MLIDFAHAACIKLASVFVSIFTRREYTGRLSSWLVSRDYPALIYQDPPDRLLYRRDWGGACGVLKQRAGNVAGVVPCAGFAA